MSRKKKGEYPSLRRHKGRGLGVVTLNGQDVYLGKWPAGLGDPPVEVQAAYDLTVAEWLQRGRMPAPPAPDPKRASATHGSLPPASLTVAELVARWWKWAEAY